MEEIPLYYRVGKICDSNAVLFITVYTKSPFQVKNSFWKYLISEDNPYYGNRSIHSWQKLLSYRTFLQTFFIRISSMLQSHRL